MMLAHRIHCSAILTIPSVGVYDYSASCTCGWDFGRFTQYAAILVTAITEHTTESLDLSCACTKDVPGLR